MSEPRCKEAEIEMHEALIAVLERYQDLSDAEAARCVNKAGSNLIALILTQAVAEERDDELRHGPPTGVRR